MINGNEYAWEDIQVMLPGKATPITGIVGVSYGTKREKKYIHGAGSDPQSIGRGKKEYPGKITLLQSTLEEIQAGLPPGTDPSDVRFPVATISYAPEGGVEVTDQWLDWEITDFEKAMKSGDTHQEIEFSVMIRKVNYNV